MKNDSKLFYITWGIGTVGLLFLAFFADGTGGGGDSVLHYLFAKYAFKHPENFFNHWAKPLFTALSSPFAQLGFVGIKLFNVICSSLSVWFSYKLLNNWKENNAWLVASVLLSITLFITVTLSGLTEPLSALILISSVYYVSNQKTNLGLTIVSFMPFVRSEGLVILGVFLIYLLIKRNYKKLPLLAVGHIVYGIIGYPYYHDLLWIFTKIPYANQTATYGSGAWNHFLLQLNFQVGPIVYSLFWMGSIALGLKLIFKYDTWKNQSGAVEKLWLVYGCFFAFLAAHSTFWALGIFNSMGLTRVFVSVMPLMAIIALDGLNALVTNDYLNKKISTITLTVLVTAILITPFTLDKYKYQLKEDFLLSDDQLVLKQEVRPFMESHFKNYRVIFTDANVPFILDIDPFNSSQTGWYYDIQTPTKLKESEVLLADKWFSRVEWGHPIENILNDSTLELNKAFPKTNSNFYVFTKKITAVEK